MFQQIYVPFDNSEHSFRALDLANLLAKLEKDADSANEGNGNNTEKNTVIGSHVYAAKLHDWRFRALESGLPEQYQKEQELERQRVIHDSLITNGLELITDSYLVVMQAKCKEAGVPFRGVSLEGRNWEGLSNDINEQDYDLVVMGAMGLGRVEGSLVGTVCERVARRVETDLIVVRELEKADPADTTAPVVACLDGSNQAWAGLNTAMDLARQTNRPLMAVSAFDPYFHYTLFDSLKTALTNEAQEVFKFEQQEQLHEDIIDSGLAKIYQSHLDIAMRLAEDKGIPIETRLLDGKPSERLLRFAKEAKPWLMIMGRTGIHGGAGMDLGGVTEHLLRLAPCNLMLTARAAPPPDAYIAGATTAWTDEGRALLDKAPASVRGVAMAAIQRFALAEGHTMITAGVVREAMGDILPPQARVAMGIDKPREPVEIEDKEILNLSYLCSGCDYVHKKKRPEVCPVCGERGSLFKVLSRNDEPGDEEVETQEAFDGKQIGWAKSALELLDRTPDPFLARRDRHRIEKKARTQGRGLITREFAAETLGLAGAAGLTGAEGLANAEGLADTTKDEHAGKARVSQVPVHGDPGNGSSGNGDAGEAHAAEMDIPAAWAEEAWQRVLRVPEGFMRDAVRSRVDALAEERGVSTIDLALVEDALARGREMMSKAMSGKAQSGEEENEAAQGGDAPGLEWSPDAEKRLEQVPKGFMREMTRQRVEVFARKKGETRITEEVLEEKLMEWQGGSEKQEARYQWEASAWERLETIPPVVRGMVMLEVERCADNLGAGEVTQAVMDQAISAWLDTGVFHSDADAGA